MFCREGAGGLCAMQGLFVATSGQFWSA
jgi:hypothetical protein